MQIIKVRGRHRMKDTILTRGPYKVRGVICMNCRAFCYLDESGKLEDPERLNRDCLSDVDCTRMGDARLGDLREQEMRLRAEQDRSDVDFLRQAGQLDEHGQPILETQRGRMIEER